MPKPSWQRRPDDSEESEAEESDDASTETGTDEDTASTSEEEVARLMQRAERASSASEAGSNASWGRASNVAASLRASAAMQMPPPRTPGGAKRSKEQRTTYTFRRARSRLQAILESESAELFSRKSWWRDTGRSLGECWTATSQYTSLWKTAIQTIEGKHGSNVSLTLYFLRFALAMNLALCLVWLACTVVPFMIWPPTTFSWAIFRDYLPLQLLQGYGLHNTFLLYGGFNYALHEAAFPVDLTFPIAVCATFFVSLLVLLYVIHHRLQGVGDSAFVGQNQLFPFSTVVFTSWDFHLTDIAASRNLRSSIRNQLKEMVNDAALDDVVHTFRARALSFLGKAAGIVIVWPVLLGLTALATYEIVTHQEAISRVLGFAFASTLALSAVNIISSNLVYLAVAAERWHPKLQTNIASMKLISIKGIYVATLVYQLYRIQTTQTAPDLGMCIPPCQEVIIGLYLYRLILTNCLSINLVDLLITSVRKIIRMPAIYDSPSAIVTVVENQTLVWLGALYSPLLPVFGLLSNVIMFYTKLLLALVAYEPPHERYSVSRTSIMAYSLMLAGLLACSVPIAFELQLQRTRCGPHQGSSMVQAIVSAAQNGPSVLLSVLTWLVSPIVLGCLVVLLVFWLIVVQGQGSRFRREKVKLRAEFDSYRREMQAKARCTLPC
ncbi:hypothetical protein WJX81_002239 [Elliptochloris bilobata]|uniref:TMC domain-containing protein n=1 Tax=Elliptochloris bilobata TaxID=381761 RepID=A0AAW1QXL8_9CHLO